MYMSPRKKKTAGVTAVRKFVFFTRGPLENDFCTNVFIKI